MNTNAGATEIDVWNGKRWRSDPSTNACDGGPPFGPCGYNGISCGSASTCMALSYACSTDDCAGGPDEFFNVWDGTRWAGFHRALRRGPIVLLGKLLHALLLAQRAGEHLGYRWLARRLP